MAKSKERLEAQVLRKKGWSIKSIAGHLDVSKASVSGWCRDIKLTQKQKDFLLEKAIKAGHKGRIIGAETNRQKKIQSIKFYKELGAREIGGFSKRDLLVAGVSLYWGEGSKTDRSALAFVNSDPDAIIFMYHWFQIIFCIPKKDFMPRIFINETHSQRIKKVLNFWSNLLQLPIEQFGNPVLLKMKQHKIYKNHESYYGVLSLKIRKSTKLKYHIMGLIGAMKQNMKSRGSSVG